MTLSVYGGIYYFSRRASLRSPGAHPDLGTHVFMKDYDLFFTFLGIAILLIVVGLVLLGTP